LHRDYGLRNTDHASTDPVRLRTDAKIFVGIADFDYSLLSDLLPSYRTRDP